MGRPAKPFHLNTQDRKALKKLLRGRVQQKCLTFGPIRHQQEPVADLPIDMIMFLDVIDE